MMTNLTGTPVGRMPTALRRRATHPLFPATISPYAPNSAMERNKSSPASSSTLETDLNAARTASL